MYYTRKKFPTQKKKKKRKKKKEKSFIFNLRSQSYSLDPINKLIGLLFVGSNEYANNT